MGPAEQIRIVIVATNALTRAGIAGVLSSVEDFEVIEFGAEHHEAPLFVEPHGADVVIVDGSAKDSEGKSIANAIRAQHPGLGLILLLSNHASSIWINDLGLGPNGYCSADVRPTNLMNAVRCVAHGDWFVDTCLAQRIFEMLGKQWHACTSDNDATRNHVAPDVLTSRETQVLLLLIKGYTNKRIADELVISLPTAKAHVRSIFGKLGVADRTQAAVEALRRKIV